MAEIIFADESYKLVGLAMEAHRELGSGFLEPVYQEAFEILLKENNIPYAREKELPIYFKGHKLEKKYFADFVCYDKIIVEMKAVSQLNSNHESQVMNYLKATGFNLGLLINFGQPSLVHRRIVFNSCNS